MAAVWMACWFQSSNGLAALGHESTSHYSHIYQRAGLRFSWVEFFKPADTNADELSFKLAPLLLQEVPPASPKPKTELPGSTCGKLMLTERGLSLDTSRPAIYVVPDTVSLNGQAHARLTYLWFYPDSVGGSEPVHLIAQGVRLTLNSAGAPVIWEELAEESGLKIAYVSESLEQAAQAEFGKPARGRKYGIERADAPDFVVARVIEDGPMPMGPILYLSRGTHYLATLICRCMPAQADNVSSTRSYELVASTSLTDALLATARAQLKNRTAFWPGNLPHARSLEQKLRLPKSGW